AVVAIDGVRDKLRVLLVSGEPHAGERTWRNLLKSDPSVDLVHFTILRPPEKQDGTPINELSLIAFPTRELFQQKINEFQLIIFDRYARQGVLPIAYFDNIARYVRSGGAVLVSAGPDYASTTSIWRTPLDSVLPAEPVGVTEKPFYAHLSDAGKRHPVTRGLEGSNAEPPHWSRFFRTVDTRNAINPPIWLWARGYEGGGPHLDLLRRVSHWLMKQPDLDEEALRMQVQGKDLMVVRQTMADTVAPVTVTSPGGATRELTLTAGDPGEWRTTLPASELGLWQATDGTLKALIN
ncbi:peptide chain release factor 3, partial [Aduncisulcus paluster]